MTDKKYIITPDNSETEITKVIPSLFSMKKRYSKFTVRTTGWYKVNGKYMYLQKGESINSVTGEKL